MTEAQLLGKWSCHVRLDAGRGDVIDVEKVTEIRPDHTFADSSKVTVMDVNFHEGGEGEWRLDGDVIVTAVHKVEFISSSNPAFGQKEWQAATRPAQYTGRGRILSFDGKRREMAEDRWLPKSHDETWSCWKL